MTYQMPQQSSLQQLLTQILQQRKQQGAVDPSGQQNIIPSQTNPSQGQTNPLSQIQAFSQILGYNPSSTFGYNLNPSNDINAPSQNLQQSGGFLGMLANLFGLGGTS